MNLIWGIRIAALVGLVGLLVWFGYACYSHGEAAGEARVHRAWDDARAAQQRAYDDQAAATEAKNEANRKASEEVTRGLREKIAGGDAASRDLSQRLREYQASLSHCRALPRAGEAPSEPAGAGGVPRRDEEVERATDAAWAACSRDAVRLDAWNAWASTIH